MLVSRNLEEAVRRIAESRALACAVAFWGRGAEALVGDPAGRHVRIVCNLATGGTNPDVIARLIAAGAEVRQCDALHAKVYVGDAEAVVTSANASINGLGLEGAEAATWIEAGVIIPARDALPWFERLWETGSRRIGSNDLTAARKTFKGRQLQRPTRPFANFDVEAEDLPLFAWSYYAEFEYDDERIEAQIGVRPKDMPRQFEYGIDVSGRYDRGIRPGTWALLYYLGARNQVVTQPAPSWTCLSGRVIEGARRYEGHDAPMDLMLAMDPPPPEPFDATELRFRQALFRVLRDPAYAAVSETNYRGSFYTPVRHALMRACWREVKRVYDSLSG